MRLVDARIRGFRNLDDAEIAFSPTVNVFLGANGQGKSNLLEAVNYPALGRSHRGARDDELIGFGQPAADVQVTAADEQGRPVTFDLALERGGGRRLRVDGDLVPRRADLLGRLASVVYGPGTVELVSGPPEQRRRFADEGLATLEAEYLRHLQDYHRALRQKARLLHDCRRGGVTPRSRDELAAWTREQAAHAAPLCAGRSAYAAALTAQASAGYRTIANLQNSLIIRYKPNLQGLGDGDDLPEMQREIQSFLDYIGEDELRRGRPLAGPQLDDFEVLLDGTSLRTYGSQGEMRSAAIALKLAQGEVFFEKRQVRPVLIFDDIFSELDQTRARRLQESCVADHQLVIATAREDDVGSWRPPGLRRWTIAGGRVEPLDRGAS